MKKYMHMSLVRDVRKNRGLYMNRLVVVGAWWSSPTQGGEEVLKRVRGQGQ